MSIVKAAKTIQLNINHIKEDGKEFNEIQDLAKKVIAKINGMKKEDKEAMKG